MANHNEHIIAGALSSLPLILQENEVEGGHNLWLALAGAFGGKLPDLFEPATSPNHRKFLHSLCFLAGVCYGVKRIYDWQPEDLLGKIVKYALLACGIGYISHLALDARTPKSLPLI